MFIGSDQRVLIYERAALTNSHTETPGEHTYIKLGERASFSLRRKHERQQSSKELSIGREPGEGRSPRTKKLPRESQDVSTFTRINIDVAFNFLSDIFHWFLMRK